MADPGTPLWLTIVLQAATLFVAHRFTVSRENNRRADDLLKEWRKDQEVLLRECVDLSIAHFIDPATLPGTGVSASRIMDKLRRFRARLGKFPTVESADSGRAIRLYVQLHGLITGDDDFQSKDRTLRDPDDASLQRIRECEDELLRNLGKPRHISAERKWYEFRGRS